MLHYHNDSVKRQADNFRRRSIHIAPQLRSACTILPEYAYCSNHLGSDAQSRRNTQLGKPLCPRFAVGKGKLAAFPTRVNVSERNVYLYISGSVPGRKPKFFSFLFCQQKRSHLGKMHTTVTVILSIFNLCDNHAQFKRKPRSTWTEFALYRLYHSSGNDAPFRQSAAIYRTVFFFFQFSR